MSKPKKPVRSKEEIIADEKRKKEIERKKSLIVDKFYPALIEATISVDESKALIQAIGTLMMEEVLKTMKERNFLEIKQSLIDKLCTDGERIEQITSLLSTFDGENLFVAREITEGMTRAIEAMITDEMRDRNLGTLKTKWNEYLN